VVDYPLYAKVQEANKIRAAKNINIFLLYQLIVDIDDKGTNLLYILMNPSRADSIQCDDAVKDILEFTKNNLLENGFIKRVKTVVIVNLFPFYETKPDHLHEVIAELKQNLKDDKYLKLMKKNMEIIKKNIKEADYIVLGWGDLPKKVNAWEHREITSEILQAINDEGNKNAFVFDFENGESITKSLNPCYPAFNRKLTGLNSCKIVSVNMVKL